MMDKLLWLIKNWQDEYIQLFNSLSDPWNTKLYDVRPPDSSDTKCPPSKIKNAKIKNDM